jgi:hypothetical protein
MIGQPGKVTLRFVALGAGAKLPFAAFSIIAGLLFCQFHQIGHSIACEDTIQSRNWRRLAAIAHDLLHQQQLLNAEKGVTVVEWRRSAKNQIE